MASERLQPHYAQLTHVLSLIQTRLWDRSKEIRTKLRSQSSVLPTAWIVFLVIEFASSALGNQTLESSEVGPWNLTSIIDPTRMALLLETRPSNLLVPLILHFASVTPPEWMFRFMGSEGSVAFIRSIPTLKRLIDAGKLETQYLPTNVTTKSQEALSVFFTDNWTYSKLLRPAEVILLYQNDAILCSNSDRNVNEWSHYPWVGAPWGFLDYGGNGGLSIRNRSALEYVTSIDSRPPGAGEWEDVWLSKKLMEHKVPNMAPKSIEMEFSSEGIYSYHPLGYHTGGSGSYLAGAVWGKPTMRHELYEWCPEIKMIVDMDANDFLPGNCSHDW
ncbi:hypothetical protein ANO11243_029120 [Dothideomycetidae sp. 11243]|nr:hypothetical protein ANO11243_029120 [fungal sp. No.11243]